ncbi:MAG: 3-keto-disaccharide hydrolase [Thalassotalea sp.]
MLNIFFVVFSLSMISLATAETSSSKPSYPENNEGFKPLFNGENFDGLYLKIRSGDAEMAKKVFAIEDKMIHVFNDEFPQEYKLDTGENDTHGLFYTKKKYSKYILKFEYKWGTRKANNFKQWQYDAGVYYHVVKDDVWPVGIEYQLRYNHITKRNHSGDLIRPKGADYFWFPDGKNTLVNSKFNGTAHGQSFLHPNKGGKETKVAGWLHLATETDNFNALNDKWNTVEIIVMGEEYAIHKLNGDVINMATNLKPSAGVIGFQAETAEIFYRNINIKELENSIPMEKFLR